MISLSAVSTVMRQEDTAVLGAFLRAWNICLHAGVSCLNACGKTHFLPLSGDTIPW